MAYFSRDNFFPESSVGFLIRVSNQLVLGNLDAVFADEDLSAVQWTALISIHFGRGETCAALARDLAHDKGAMTRMIDALESKGLVARQRDTDDRRLVNLSLTEAGEEAAMRCRDRVIQCWNQWLDGWTHEEIASFIAQLQKLRRTLEVAPSCAA